MTKQVAKPFIRRDKSDGSEKPVPRSSVERVCEMYASDPQKALESADRGERVESPLASYVKKQALKSAVSSVLLGVVLNTFLITAFAWDETEIFENSRRFFTAIFG